MLKSLFDVSDRLFYCILVIETFQIYMLRFGVITDLHYCQDKPWRNRYFSKTLEKLDEVIQVFNSQHLDFIVNLGDTIDKGFENFPVIKDKLNQFKHPVYSLIGNHDYEVVADKKPLIPGILELESNYYEVLINNYQLLFLDGNEISTYANNPDTRNYQLALEEIEYLNNIAAPNAKTYNGGIGHKQLAWIERKLMESASHQLLTLIFCHFPIFPADKYNLLNDYETIRLLAKTPHVKAWICGHNHGGNFGKINQCNVINIKGLVETETHNSFAIFELHETTINKVGFGKEPDNTFTI